MAMVALPDTGGSTGPIFKPRTTAPSTSDKNWLVSPYGYNQCILISGTSALPNCVGYAWGRWRELLGSNPTLSRNNARNWYNTNDGYRRGKTARLGAVACWDHPSSGGHVAVVEKVNADGSFEVSESAYGGDRFHYGQVNANGTCQYLSSAYTFQGFIYFPTDFAGSSSGVNYLALLVAEAKSHIGENYVWTNNMTGVGVGAHWCAAFVRACCMKVGIAGKIMINNSYAHGCGNIMRYSIPKGMGSWLPGPNQGKHPTPQPGDFIFFRWEQCARADTYDSDHVGIVVDVSSTQVTTVEGNTASNYPTASKVSQYSYSLNYSCINGYYRPNWSIVGGSVAGLYGGFSLAPLYNTEYTRADGLIREVAYVDSKTEPSIKSSNIKLSVMNYTQLLASAFEIMAQQYGGTIGGGGGTADVSQLSAVPRGIVEFWMAKGYAAAVGVGVAANVEAECSFKIGSSGMDSNGYMSGGMCQWNDIWAGFTMMKKFVGANWQTNLTGQLNFMWYHLTTLRELNGTGALASAIHKTRVASHYGQSINYTDWLKSIPNTEAGARKAAESWVWVIELPGDTAGEARRRADKASNLWKSVIPQLSATAAGGT